ncbi:MAG TPA: proton-conducting transporter membrane subunit [Candidatus Limnocylindrales bacterium]|nr:proton-conducting transporter membrane subunit [Candidatus Limnocylindrales bacterium]
MTVLPFLAITFGAAAASLLTRGNRRVSVWIGILGLLAAAVAAARIGSSDSLEIGGGVLAGSEYLRLFALLGSLVSLALVLLGLVANSHRNAPGVLLAGIGAGVLALSLSDARIAVLAATAGGLVGILVTIDRPATARSVIVATRELRALAIAGLLAILATAWIARPLGDLAAVPDVFGFAYVGFAVAVAIRFGAIPFHFWAARLADAAPEITLPMLMAWGPAAFAVVALAWADQSVAPLLLPLTAERIAVVAVGAVSAVLGMLAAWIQDDLEHVVGYTIIADAGIAILGLAALDPAAWEPARTWILVFVTVRSAFAAWAVSVRAAFGSRRVSDLAGWAVRAPLLGVALGIVALAAVGFPGLATWNARTALVDLTLAGPLGIVVVLSGVAQLAIYGRLLYVGLSRPSDAVRAGQSQRPTWPEAVADRNVTGRGRVERVFERGSHAGGAALDVIWSLPGAFRANRGLLAGVLALAVAGLALTISSGGLGVVEAASAVPGQDAGPGPQPGDETGPEPSSFEPEASEAVPSEPPTSGPPGSAPPSGRSPEPSFQPLPSG